jgi:hypothetical protein
MLNDWLDQMMPKCRNVGAIDRPAEIPLSMRMLRCAA